MQHQECKALADPRVVGAVIIGYRPSKRSFFPRDPVTCVMQKPRTRSVLTFSCISGPGLSWIERPIYEVGFKLTQRPSVMAGSGYVSKLF